jgi:hypothetical protein
LDESRQLEGVRSKKLEELRSFAEKAQSHVEEKSLDEVELTKQFDNIAADGGQYCAK